MSSRADWEAINDTEDETKVPTEVVWVVSLMCSGAPKYSMRPNPCERKKKKKCAQCLCVPLPSPPKNDWAKKGKRRTERDYANSKFWRERKTRVSSFAFLAHILMCLAVTVLTHLQQDPLALHVAFFFFFTSLRFIWLKAMAYFSSAEVWMAKKIVQATLSTLVERLKVRLRSYMPPHRNLNSSFAGFKKKL